ncbi:MAG: hypothetical protein N2111_04175 [Candidatus Sumerlaeaceae bacterium]|nr:hypothetical protein [Candidatus Sumerlaeaceae bacterium]
MTRGRLLAICIVLVVAPAVACADGAYRTRQLSPEHKRELRQSIAELVAQVNAAPDVATRGRYQEELCKKLLQAEDYESALKVAHSVYSTPGIEPERRAAHHYLIAQIYAYRMKASPTVTLMEENRRMAAEVAADVVKQRYPKQWMVTEAARTLLKELEDRKQLAAIRAEIEKRRGGGVVPGNIALAQSQSVALEGAGARGAAARAAGSGSVLFRNRPVEPEVTIAPRRSSTPVSRVPSVPAAPPEPDKAMSGPQPRQPSKEERIESVYAARHDRLRTGSGGLIIDGGSVRPVGVPQGGNAANP